ncbi:uncharacterized protein LOC124162366 [Ischnura elegans]|uniref:uncharacterized protein LOC124162366 n=1 Tax=Ischnura elegans TaxID=197161 RepID=UPI001ED884A9|nr:uncharacterized protein LOC124162366 [Ischnura elegans]XP_046394833.1 uncharacterized protein LOC124162366 [Ischnura elegans]XP_046394835.1 uncharacterized protein LOC124162366 [Ischnura elegans]
METSLWTKLLKRHQVITMKQSSPKLFDIVGKLPEEISISILRLLDNASLLSCALVSKRWFYVIHSDSSLRFRVFNRLRRLRWVKQKYGEPKEPKQLPRIVAYGLDRVHSVYEKYQMYQDRKEKERDNKRRTAIMKDNSKRRIFADYMRRKIFREPKILVPGLNPPPAEIRVYRRNPFSDDDAS